MPEKLPFEFVLTPAFGADPYRAYDAIRDLGPVHPIDFPPGFTAFIVIDHELGRAALTDPRLSKSVEYYRDYFRRTTGEDEIVFDANMLTADPPDHTRLRKLVSKAFTARRVEALRPRVQQLTDELLDAMAPHGEADLIEALAFPLPIIVISELLGVPVEDRDRLRDWSTLLINPGYSEEDKRSRAQATRETNEYFAEMIERRRAEPGDDLISGLLAVHEEGGLTDKEMLSTLSLLMIAGHETTVNLISNGVFALLRNPDQLKLLRDDPTLLPSAIEEFLRYDGPVERSTPRFAAEELELGGVTIPAGSMVHISLGALAHDPAVFTDPGQLDITRSDNRHLAFGHGIHYCLGAPLARLEGQIAIGTLLERFPGLELGAPLEQIKYKITGAVTRGLNALPVRF
ncbi:cytochrome P450 family protein [Acrocarpospora catenulata]|uniref:cytochrome P450 family protein n=1 Tax=Acrocarpospora catenulata TaxID=2836182 RepID=UPI001BDB482C|nr:cytochrome P450 [Acrocarpospora catenulata]